MQTRTVLISFRCTITEAKPWNMRTSGWQLEERSCGLEFLQVSFRGASMSTIWEENDETCGYFRLGIDKDKLLPISRQDEKKVIWFFSRDAGRLMMITDFGDATEISRYFTSAVEVSLLYPLSTWIDLPNICFFFILGENYNICYSIAAKPRLRYYLPWV